MNTQHTSDSWYFSACSSGQGIIARECDGKTIAVTYDQADMPLIAAAPDLLAALNASTIALQDFQREAGMQTHPKLHWQIVENLKLINKAKGSQHETRIQ